jgi:FMN-dependent dehydrogenase
LVGLGDGDEGLTVHRVPLAELRRFVAARQDAAGSTASSFRNGGRQLDQAPASLEALPAIKAAVGDKLTVMLDSGVR